MATPYANPAAASTALTSAFTPAGGSLTPQQAAAIAAASALVPTAPAPVLSPIQPAPLAAPTVGSIYGTDPYSAASINAAQQAASNFSGAGLDQGTQDSIRQQTLASFQAEIDAQNRVYADKLSQAQVTGAGRLGSTTAIEARRGLLGSDFGAAQTDTTTAANQSVYDSINNEKAAAIANINSAGRAAVTQALAEKTAAKQAGLDSYVKYLSDAGARAEKGATTAATLLLNNGTDPNTLDATSYQNLLNNYGITREGLTSAYNAAKKLAADAAAKAAADAQALTDKHAESISSIAKNAAGITDAEASQKLAQQKFEEDKRQFGLTYAQNQQKINQTANASGTGTYVAGANPIVDSWVERIQNGSAKITEIPASQAALRNAVSVGLIASGNTLSGKPDITELGKSAKATAQSLLDKFNAGFGLQSSPVGVGSLSLTIPGTPRADFVNDFNSLKSQLALEGVKYLKGQGAVSDAERALLASAVTKLSLSQSKGEFKTTLQRIIDKLAGDPGASPPAGADGAAFGFPGYHSDGTQWVPN